MKKLLPEKKVLKLLGIEDFRHLSKDKVIKMASMLDRMDPEVAKKALEQFPEFSSTIKEKLSEYKETIDNELAQNEESVKSYHEACTSIITSLNRQLESDNLTFDEKKYIIDKTFEVAKMMGDKDTENKKFLLAMALLAGATVVASSIILGNTLGSKAEIEDKSFDE